MMWRTAYDAKMAPVSTIRMFFPQSERSRAVIAPAAELVLSPVAVRMSGNIRAPSIA